MAEKPVRRLVQAEEIERRMSIGEYNTLSRVREQMARNPEFAKVMTGLSNENTARLRARLAAEKAGLTKTNYENIRQRAAQNPKDFALLNVARRANFGLSNRKR